LIYFAYFCLGLFVGVGLTVLWLAVFAGPPVDHVTLEPVQRQPDFGDAYMEREARRVERPLYEKSVAGVVVKD
jgi:hypothetical protein